METRIIESRARASPKQFATLLEFMERHGDIGRPQQGPQRRLEADFLWQSLVRTLNSSGGGVKRNVEKWKKVWADWKTKTKKKALAMRREAGGTGGDPSSRKTLTALEERVLATMGLPSVTGQVGIEERGIDAPPSESTSAHHTVCTQFDTDRVKLKFSPTIVEASTASASLLPPPSEVTHIPPSQIPVRGATPISPTSPIAEEAPRRPRRPSTQSPSASRPRWRRLLRARTRRVQMQSEFVGIESRRLRLEELRQRNLYRIQMERCQIEMRRIEMEERRNEVFNRLAGVLDRLTDILS